MIACSIRILALACLLTIAGCSGKRQATNPDNEQWFCQSNESGSGWECVQDDRLAQNPIPTRLPPAPQPQPQPSEFGPLGWDTPQPPVEDGENVTGREEFIAAETVEVTTEDQVTDTAAGVQNTPVTGTSPDGSNSETSTTEVTGTETTAIFADGSQETQVPKHVRLAYVPSQPTPIMQLNPNFYAVQLLAMDTKAEIENYINENALIGMSAAEVENGGSVYYVLILGIYETYAIAREAATDLPPPLDEITPWIRPLGELQEAMARADSGTGESDQDSG